MAGNAGARGKMGEESYTLHTNVSSKTPDADAEEPPSSGGLGHGCDGLLWTIPAAMQHGGMLILLMVDVYSRYVIAHPVRSTDIDSAKGVLLDVMDTYGRMKRWHTDTGPPFNGKGYADFAKELGTELTFSTPLDAQQNGAAESYMRSIKKAMAVPTVEGISWKVSLGQTIAAHNAARCEATGVAPEELMFGRKLRRGLPSISTAVSKPKHAEIAKRDWALKTKHKNIADKKRDARYSSIAVGDKVFVSRPTLRKGQTNYDPTEFTVIRKKHGTLDLLSPLGNVMSRTIPFVVKVPEQQQHLQSKPEENEDGEEEPAKIDKGSGKALKSAKEAVKKDGPTELRRSERLRKPNSGLRDYVAMLEERCGKM